MDYSFTITPPDNSNLAGQTYTQTSIYATPPLVKADATNILEHLEHFGSNLSLAGVGLEIAGAVITVALSETGVGAAVGIALFEAGEGLSTAGTLIETGSEIGQGNIKKAGITLAIGLAGHFAGTKALKAAETTTKKGAGQLLKSTFGIDESLLNYGAHAAQKQSSNTPKSGTQKKHLAKNETKPKYNQAGICLINF